METLGRECVRLDAETFSRMHKHQCNPRPTVKNEGLMHLSVKLSSLSGPSVHVCCNSRCADVSLTVFRYVSFKLYMFTVLRFMSCAAVHLDIISKISQTVFLSSVFSKSLDVEITSLVKAKTRFSFRLLSL